MKASRIISVLAVLFLLSIFASAAFASVNDDQVTSQKIKEADGTSGQNTNTGSGVKTGHIQDNAVTTTKIANGAVTDAKISGTISLSKITGLETTLAGKSDVTHNHDALYQQKYGKVAVVAQTGGDYDNPISAMNDLAVWCGNPSAVNPCLLKIMPGVYDIGTNQLVLNNSYVDIEGSGENVTKIYGSRSSHPMNGHITQSAVVLAYGNVNEIRSITIENVGSGDYFVSALLTRWTSVKLMNVTLITSGPAGESFGFIAVGGSATFNNATINSTSSGITHGASLSDGAFLMLKNSEILRGEITIASTGYLAVVVNSMVAGGINLWNGATAKCIGAYNTNYDLITCP